MFDESIKDHQFEAAKYYTKKSSIMLMLLFAIFFLFPYLLGYLLQGWALPLMINSDLYSQ